MFGEKIKITKHLSVLDCSSLACVLASACCEKYLVKYVF